VGLLVGDPETTVRGAVLSIDLSETAIALAKRKDYKLIINHHPCIFPKSRGLARVTAASSPLVFEALREGISVLACHTNFDRCALEVVESVSKGLGLAPKGRLMEKATGSLIKLIVFVPSSHLEAVRSALFSAGAGQIGLYDECSFGAEGQGTFRGSEDTRPLIGTAGTRETVTETRLETVFPRGLEKSVLQALFKAHPYEEVAFDLVPVEQGPAATGLVRGLGYGFWGEFPKPKLFTDVTRGVKHLFNLDGLWITDPRPSRVRRVAFVAGKGASFVEAAVGAGCDLMITGEAGYHTALSGARKGMAVMEIGHRESEAFFVPTVRDWLAKQGVRSVDASRRTQRVI
jgi:dinuclear metal center YbgI/SA1388 family protein